MGVGWRSQGLGLGGAGREVEGGGEVTGLRQALGTVAGGWHRW